MLLFVAAAAFALLLAPTRGDGAPAKKSSAAFASLPASADGEIADPWSRRSTKPRAPSALSRQAAELAADEVVDPWAQRPLPPPTAVTVLDVPVDPWAGAVDFAAAATPAAPGTLAKGSSDRDDGLRDPWRSRRAAARTPKTTAPSTPRPSPSIVRHDEVANPWKGRSLRPKASPASRARPRVLPPAQPSTRARDGLVDPWK